jgi:amino acid adenylation domain-containing protein
VDVQAGGVRRVGAARDYPLTFMQREMWFQCQLHADTPHYRIAFASTITGPLDRARFVRALQAVVDRQAVLRTGFHAPDGDPRQVIVPRLDVELPYEDLSTENVLELDEGALRARVYERFSAIANDPFDLTRAPLWRAALFRIDEHRHWLIFLFHQLIMDGHHAGALVGEIGATYWRHAHEGEGPSAPFPLEYRDFAVWLDERRRTGQLGEHESFWLDRLRAPQSEPVLPRDRLAPVHRRFGCEGLWRQLDPALSEALAPLGRTCRATPYRVILAAFAIVVGRFSTAREIRVAHPFSTQPPELQDVAGLYANTLPVRIWLDPRQSFRDFARAVSRELDEVRRHREFPIVDAFRQIGSEHEGHTVAPLRIGASQLAHVDLQLPGLRVEQRPSFFSGAQLYDLWLGVKELSSGISLTFAYAAELFERDTFERFAAYVQTLLADAVRHPDRPIGELRLVAPAEDATIGAPSAAAHPPAPSPCVHELFERQARCTPAAIALTCGSRVVTYRELDAQANQLAHWLRSRGVAPATLVPVLIESSPAAIVGMLGVLKAGGAYVPIDPESAATVWRTRLDAVGSPVLLTERSLVARLWDAGDFAGHVHCLDEVCAAVAAQPSSVPEPAAGTQTACVQFTPESTDAPAGVLVTHRALARLVQRQEYVQLGSDDAILQLSPCTSGAAAFEIWGALLNGARLVLVPRSTSRDTAALADLLRTERITTLALTAASFNRLIDERAGALSGLRTLIVSGAPVSVSHFRRASSELAGTRVLRVYGPVESTAWSTWERVEQVAPTAAAIRVGRPIAGTTAYVLDENLRPVPIKVKGDIWLGGDGLAAGYLHRADLTADRFVPNPFASGERLYRTGDHGRWHADGSLEVVADADLPAASDDRRTDRTTVDRPDFVGPTTDAERQIAAAWEEVLGTSRVGVHDNYFEIGGDSIAWIRIAGRLRARGLALQERDLLHHRTVATQAACVQQRSLASAAPAVARLDSRATAPVDEDELAALLAVEGEA